MPRPAILVVATPYVYASVIADAIRHSGRYDVVMLDLTVDEVPGSGPFAAAVTSVPFARDGADVLIELPDSFDRPVIVRIGDISVEERVDPNRPLEDVVALLGRYVIAPSTRARSKRPRR